MARDTSTKTLAADGKGQPAKQGRVKQIRDVYKMTRENDPKLPLVLSAWGLGALVVFVALGFALGHPVFYGIFGIPIAALAIMIVFGRRAQKAAYGSLKGQAGAAAGVLDQLKRGWDVTPAVRVNPRSQDMVHRVLGRPGIILVGEGSPQRLKPLFAEERKHLTRLFGPNVPLVGEDIIAGDEAGQVPLTKLQRHVMRLKPAKSGYLRPAQVQEYSNRLKAVGLNLPIPKGPMPKGGKMPRG